MYYQMHVTLTNVRIPMKYPYPYLQVCCSIGSACMNLTQEKDFIS